MQSPVLENILRVLSLGPVHLKVPRTKFPPHWKSRQTVARIPHTLGELLKRKRIKQHLLQREVAKKLIVSIATISHWERGVKSPSRIKQKILQEFLNDAPKSSVHETKQNCFCSQSECSANS